MAQWKSCFVENSAVKVIWNLCQRVAAAAYIVQLIIKVLSYTLFSVNRNFNLCVWKHCRCHIRLSGVFTDWT